MKASWERLGVDPALVERTRAELAGGSALVGAQTEAAEAPRAPRSSGSGRSGLGVGALARSLIVERPDWTYRRIAEEVNARIVGARASEKSVRWYSHQMRKKGTEGTERKARKKLEGGCAAPPRRAIVRHRGGSESPGASRAVLTNECRAAMRAQLDLALEDDPVPTGGVADLVVNEDIHVSKSTFLNGLANRVHRWFRLTPSFGPELVHEMIDKLGVGRDETILDPFAGAGTTLIEAKLEGRRSFGFEVNPLLHFVNEACLDWSVTSEALRSELRRLETACRNQSGATLASLVERGFEVPPIHNHHRWWRDDVLADLLVLREAIDTTTEPRLRRLLRLAFAGVLVPDLTNVTLGKLQLHFIDRSGDVIDTWGTFQRHVLQIANDLDSLRAAGGQGEAHCYHQDSTRLAGLKVEHRADAVITSPPYPNRYSYVWNTRPHLYMLGLMKAAKEASELDKRTIGGTWGTATSELSKGVFAPINAAVADVVLPVTEKIREQDGLMANYVVHYFNRLTAQIMEMEQVVSPRARIAYVVGNSWIKEVYVETDVMLGDIVDRLGLGYRTTEVHRFRRRHSGKRLYESIVYAFKRP